MANEEHVKRLKQGVEGWNKWRDDNEMAQAVRPEWRRDDPVRPDLSGAILINADLGGANLIEVDLSGAGHSTCRRAALRRRAVQADPVGKGANAAHMIALHQRGTPRPIGNDRRHGERRRAWD
jgi:Pentapeptide repeats (8 copies)